MAETPQQTTRPATWGTTLWSNLVSLAILLWFCLRNLSVALEVRGRMAALFSVPPLWLYGGGLALAVACLVAGAVARLRGLTPDRPVYRLLPILAVVFLGAEVFAVPRALLPVSADQIIDAQASMLEPEAFAEEDGLFTVDAARVAAGLQGLEAPFVNRVGKPVGPWNPIVHAACASPASAVPAAVETGAVLYCVNAERTVAWLSFVGLEGLAGQPRIVALDESGSTVRWERSKPVEPAPQEAATPVGPEGPNE